MGEEPDAPPNRPRLFTVAEANALLPSLVPTLLELRAAKAALDDARRALAALTPAMRGNGHGPEATRLEDLLRALAADLTNGIRRITRLGVQVKDLDHGLIDFPARREDRLVLLCWHLGDGPVAYWHEIDAGYAGRQPL